MKLRALLLLVLASAFITCKPDKEETIENEGATYDGTAFELLYPNHFPAPTLPADNPLTIQGVKLGQMIFHETMLSGDNTQSCADCHLQQFAFTDSARFSIGIAGLPGGRQAMSVFNMAWNDQGFFWDGRAAQLRDQSLMPIQDPLEMNETLDNVISNLSSMDLYKDQFMRAFGSETITAHKMSLALEQFMLSIVSSD